MLYGFIPLICGLVTLRMSSEWLIFFASYVAPGRGRWMDLFNYFHFGSCSGFRLCSLPFLFQNVERCHSNVDQMSNVGQIVYTPIIATMSEESL